MVINDNIEPVNCLIKQCVLLTRGDDLMYDTRAYLGRDCDRRHLDRLWPRANDSA
jgi:hypothetical protein